MITSGLACDLTKLLGFHPFMLSGLTNTAASAFHGRSAADRFGVVVQAVQRAMSAAWRSNRRGLLRALSGAQGGWDVERALGWAQLARLQWELMQGGGGETRGCGRVIGGSSCGRVGRRRVTIDRDLVPGGGSGSNNVGSHDLRDGRRRGRYGNNEVMVWQEEI